MITRRILEVWVTAIARGHLRNTLIEVWVTAIARAHLRKMLNIVGNDVVYCDTDSVKFLKEIDT